MTIADFATMSTVFWMNMPGVQMGEGFAITVKKII